MMAAALLVAAAIAVILLVVRQLAVRRDLQRLLERLQRDSREATASIGVDSFGAADELASRIYAMQSQLERKVDAAEWQSALLQHLINGVGEGVLAVDRQRRIVLANRRLTEIFSLEPGFIGSLLTEVIRNATVLAGFDEALAHRESAQRMVIRAGSEERSLEMRAFRLPSSDLAAVALFIDVTRLERLEEVRREFIADFSHEVRTPLAALRSAVDSFELGQGRNTAEEDRQLRRIITRQLQRLERLAEDLAQLSQIEAGDLSLDMRETDLNQLLEDLCEDFADRAAQKSMQMRVTGSAISLMADPMRLQQLFANLIDNALKYGPPGSTVEISVETRPEQVVVRVRDEGEGVPPHERDRIFRRFYRVDKSRSQEVPGTGLGLAITRHLVRLHGGTIDVETPADHGATFVVSLPRRGVTAVC